MELFLCHFRVLLFSSYFHTPDWKQMCEEKKSAINNKCINRTPTLWPLPPFLLGSCYLPASKEKHTHAHTHTHLQARDTQHPISHKHDTGHVNNPEKRPNTAMYMQPPTMAAQLQLDSTHRPPDSRMHEPRAAQRGSIRLLSDFCAVAQQH